MEQQLRQSARSALVGAFEERVRELVGRVRAGTLSRDRVELAAAMGDPVACAAVGAKPPLPTAAPIDFWDFVEEIERFGPEPLTLFALEVSRELRRFLVNLEGEDLVDAALALAERWLRRPSLKGARQLPALSARARRLAVRAARKGGLPERPLPEDEEPVRTYVDERWSEDEARGELLSRDSDEADEIGIEESYCNAAALVDSVVESVLNDPVRGCFLLSEVARTASDEDVFAEETAGADAKRRVARWALTPVSSDTPL